MKRDHLNLRVRRQLDRGCVVLDQPQRSCDWEMLRLVCDTAAILPVVLFLCLLALAPVHAATQVGSAPYRASATGAGNSHSPVFSADGKHVAFVSHANNLVTNDDLAPHLDLFVRDLVNSNTVLVSVSTNGFGGANHNIGLYTLSSNAQVVAFDTAANNLVAWDNNRVSDIYARDVVQGSMTRVSMGVDGDANGPSSDPLISEDGRYIIFESLASNLVTNDFNGTNDIFIHDLTTGLTELVSVNADGTASPDGPSHSPSISADGLTIAFVSHATNLVEGVTNTLGEVYARNVVASTTLWAMASHLAATHSRSPASGILEPYVAAEPALSDDGRHVVFKTRRSTVRFDFQRATNSQNFAYTNTTSVPPFRRLDYFQFEDNPRLSASSSRDPLTVTPDGRYAIYTTATNIVPSPGIIRVDFESLVTNAIWTPGAGGCVCPDYYVTNVGPAAEIIVTNFISFQGQATWTQMPWIDVNSDGSRLFFSADPTNLISSVTKRTFQIYSFDLLNRTLGLLSANRDSMPGLDLGNVQPSISPDGLLLAWDSPDDNIVGDDLNRAWDVFVRNVDTGETQVVSVPHPGLPPMTGRAMASIAGQQSISGDGSKIVVLSRDGNLMTDDTNALTDAVLRDLLAQTNFSVSGEFLAPVSPRAPIIRLLGSTNEVFTSAISANGRYVMFGGRPFDLGPGSMTRTLLPWTNLYWRDLELNTNHYVSDFVLGSKPALGADGLMVAYDSYMNYRSPPALVYLRDFRSFPSVAKLISRRRDNPTAPANGPSINPDFSPDSRWLVFQSLATDLTQDSGSVTAYQLYAREIDSVFIKRISYSTIASTGPNGISTDLPLPGGGANPHFSADARHVAFESAPNLIFRHDLLNDWVVKTVIHPDPIFNSFTNRARFTNDLVCSNCFNPTLNADGRYVAYETLSASGTIRGILVKDLQTGQEESISVSLTGTNGNGPSSTPLLSHDARFVVFSSKASDLVPGDNNRATDIFVRDRLNQVTHCLSRNFAGTSTGNRVSSNPILSADGRTVAFQSFASDLVPGDYNDTRDVFVVTLDGPDTDGDGMDDDWEMAYFSTVDRDGSGDFDNDGAGDLAEFRAGTNPANDASILRVLTLTTSLAAGPSPHRITVLLWSAIPGKTYRVQFKASLDASWATVGADVTAGSTSASLTDTVEATDEPNNPHRFYRVLLVQ